MNLYKLFKNKSTVEVPASLLEQVFLRIDQEIQKRAIKQRYAWGVISLISLSSLVASGIYAFRAFAISDFGSYFSLIFSDSRLVLTLWRQVGLSFLESFPMVGIIIFLASIVFLLGSIRRYIKYTGNTINHTSTVATA